MTEQIFSLTYNQETIQPDFRVIAPGDLGAGIVPRKEWHYSTAWGIENATLEVFQTPLEGFTDLEVELRQKRGQAVGLGNLTTHVMSGDDIAVRAELGNLYDIFCVTQKEDGTRALFGGARYAVTEEPGHEVDQMLTFEEAKFFGYIALGLEAEQAKDVEATVRPMAGYGNRLPGIFIVAGFDLGDRSDDNPIPPGLMVDHRGGVQFYYGRTAAQTLKAISLAARPE